MVRLGEYDITTTDDGPHEDIQIDHVEGHEDHHPILGINDIAIVYLKYHVNFNCKLNMFYTRILENLM